MTQTPCQSAPEMWVADQSSSRREAAALCHDCPVITDCLETAIIKREKFGVWGGVDFSDARTRPKFGERGPTPISHGTEAGYQAHRRRGEMPCIACTGGSAQAKRLRRMGRVA